MPEAHFDRFSISLALDDALSASHPGNCDQEVEDLRRLEYVADQLESIPDGDLFDELREYGAWNHIQLQDREENERRIVWIAAGNIREKNA